MENRVRKGNATARFHAALQCFLPCFSYLPYKWVSPCFKNLYAHNTSDVKAVGGNKRIPNFIGERILRHPCTSKNVHAIGTSELEECMRACVQITGWHVKSQAPNGAPSYMTELFNHESACWGRTLIQAFWLITHSIPFKWKLEALWILFKASPVIYLGDICCVKSLPSFRFALFLARAKSKGKGSLQLADDASAWRWFKTTSERQRAALRLGRSATYQESSTYE